MDSVRNPFAPGAGSQPPELAGRETIIKDARTSLQRAIIGKHSRSQMLLGFRGVGKTVLLNRIEQIAEDEGHLTSFIEAPEDQSLPILLYPRIAQTLRRLSLLQQSKALAHDALRALRSFVSVFKIDMGDFSISVDPEPGVADSGNLEFDLPDLFIKVGEAARAAGKGWTLLIDEVQYIKNADFAALIVAVHKIDQRNLPVVFFGAGLPQAAALSGDAKSYAERLFEFPKVDALEQAAAEAAIRNPIENEEEAINTDALRMIVRETQGYPYFLQEWGYQTWNTAPGSPIKLADVQAASSDALRRLDDGFFRVRFDRLTVKEKRYVLAMASLGNGPYKTSDVAEKMDVAAQSLGPTRASIIQKGMIYSPSYGDLDFTIPLFADYLRRRWA